MHIIYTKVGTLRAHTHVTISEMIISAGSNYVIDPRNNQWNNITGKSLMQPITWGSAAQNRTEQMGDL